MNPPSLHSVLFLSLCLCLGLAGAGTSSAQSVGRIRKSLDKATGGATQPPPPRAPAPAPVPVPAPVPADPQAAARSQAQSKTNAALAEKRNKAAQAEKDQKVVDFLKQRIEDGSADAAFDLAKRYEDGKGVKEDPKEARRLYSLAAERGNTEAKTWIEAHPEKK